MRSQSTDHSRQRDHTPAFCISPAGTPHDGAHAALLIHVVNPLEQIRRTVLFPVANLMVAIGIVALLAGCTGCRFGLRGPEDGLASAPRPRFSTDPQMEEIVDHLNRNVSKLHAWQARTVKIRANNMPGLKGSLAVEEGQHLRMVVDSPLGREVDMGSNQDSFWIWAKRLEPAYVFCRHEQIEAARQSLGVPFEPQFLMQALGVAPLETKDLKMQIDPTGQRARLIQPVVMAHGHSMQKVMTVDLVHGVVTEHCIHDGRGHIIALARLEEFRMDKQSGVIMPHRLKLDWPQQQMSLVMNLGHVEINPPSIPSQIWDMPRMPGVQMVDLGKDAQVGMRIGDQRTAQSTQLQQQEDPAADDDTGRIQLSLDESDGPEIQFDRPESVDPVEYKTAPIERPEQKKSWDE